MNQEELDKKWDKIIKDDINRWSWRCHTIFGIFWLTGLIIILFMSGGCDLPYSDKDCDKKAMVYLPKSRHAKVAKAMAATNDVEERKKILADALEVGFVCK